MDRRGKDSFLVTLWTDGSYTDGGVAAGWRGSVEHLATRRRLYFSAPSELIGFLGNQVRESGARADDLDD